jgi:hypothetical protein
MMRWLPPHIAVFALALAAAAPAPAAPSARLGMCHGGDYPTMVAAGIGWSRHDLTWSAAEPQRGTFDWGWYDAVVERGEQAGLEILPILCYSAAYWPADQAQPSQPWQYEDYGRFAHEAAAHYRSRIYAFEVWNEPNLGGFWQGEPNARDYVEMLRHAYQGIKDANPQATVIGGSIAAVGRLDWPYLEAMFAHGAARYMDALSLHPYRPMPEAGQPKIAYRVRELLARHGVPDMPIWITEEGWSLPDDPRTPTDEAWHADYFARSTLISWAVGNAVHIWYAWGGNYGLARDGGLRPAYRACQTLTEAIGDRKPVGFLPLAWPNYGVVFADQSGAVAALWRPFDRETVTLDLPAAGARVFDQYGMPLHLEGRKIAIEITPSVTYVAGLGREAVRLAAAQVYPREISFAPGEGQILKVWPSAAIAGGRMADIRWHVPTGWSVRSARADGIAYDGTHPNMTAWRVTPPRDARAGRVPIRAACRIDGDEGSFETRLLVSATVRPPVAWDYQATSPIYSDCLAVDIDGDGQTEVVGAARWSQIFCLDGRGREKWSFRPSDAMNSSPAAADLDGDGKIEIVALPNDGQLIALSPSGSLLWRTDLEGHAEWGGSAIADFDADGKLEIMVSGDSFAACVAADGKVMWRHPLPKNAGGRPAVGDVDGDGAPEAVFPCADGITRCFEADGSLRWVWRNAAGASAAPVLVDLDGDRRLDVVFAADDRTATGASGTDGAQLWRFGLRGGLDSTLAAGDVNDDGQPEILVGDMMGGIYCIGADGSEVWHTGIAATTEAGPAIADIDGDGRLEIIVGDTGGTVHCFDSRGDLVWKFETKDKIAGTPLVADVNDDGRLELVVGSTDGHLYCLALSGAADGRRPWPSARADAANTGTFTP